MKRTIVIGILGAALAGAGCEGEPVGHKFKIGKDGTIIPGSIEPMSESEAVAIRQQQVLFSDVGYVVDCGQERFPMPWGEGVVFDETIFTGRCSAISWNASREVRLDLFAPVAKWSNGVSFNDRIRSSAFRAPTDTGMCVIYEQHCVFCSGNRQRVFIPTGAQHQFPGPNATPPGNQMADASGLHMYASGPLGCP